MSDWIACTDRLPISDQRVDVISESWPRSKRLVYKASQPQGFLDPATQTRYWYPERMKWRAQTVTVPQEK